MPSRDRLAAALQTVREKRADVADVFEFMSLTGIRWGEARAARVNWLSPCRGYLPIYRDGRIAVSFKPTARGLYAALNMIDPVGWPDRVAHKPSLGGSPRLKDGIYISDQAALHRLLAEVN